MLTMLLENRNRFIIIIKLYACLRVQVKKQDYKEMCYKRFNQFIKKIRVKGLIHIGYR